MTGPTPPGWHETGPPGAVASRYRDGISCTGAGSVPPVVAARRGFGRVVSAHPGFTGMAALVGLVLILTHWTAFVLLAGLVAVVTGLAVLTSEAVRARRHRLQALAQTAARADDQHHALLRGDDQWGVFGISSAADPFVQPPGTSGKLGRSSLLAGVAVVLGFLVITMMATAKTPSAGPPPRLASAPTVTVTQTERRPTPRPMNPVPALDDPFRMFPALVPAPLPGPASPPTKPAAPPVRLGQQAVDGSLTFVVTSVDRSKTVANPVASFMQTAARGTFLTAELTITNNGTQPEVFIASYQRLRINAAVYAVDPVAALWTLTFDTVVGPGVTETAALSFDVPTDTPAGGIVELHGSLRSPGAEVELLAPQ
jgi:uncharacterized protein DUF4352